jgi:uncharacterized membrane protein
MGTLIVALSTSIIVSSLIVTFLNPLRPTLNSYRKLTAVQQQAMAAAGEVINALLVRTGGMIVCDVCGKVIENIELGCIRPGDRGRVMIGHAECFPPMGPM